MKNLTRTQTTCVCVCVLHFDASHLTDNNSYQVIYDAEDMKKSMIFCLFTTNR